MLSFFNRLSFKNKLILITIPMFLGNLMWGNLVVWEHGKIMYDAKGLEENLHFIGTTSNFLREIQKERDSSVLFLDSGLTKDELEKLRQKSDLAFNEFKLNINKTENSFKSYTENILKMESDARKFVDDKSNKKEVFEQYTKIISNLSEIQIKTSDINHLNGIESFMDSLNVLEAAKDNLWKLRENLYEIIKSNKAMTTEEVENLHTIKTTFVANLTSQGLQVSDNGHKEINSILASKEWNDLKLNLNKILEKSSVGNYGINYTDLVSNFDQIDNSLQKLITSENKQIDNKIENEVYMARIWFYGASGFLTFATIIVAILLISFIRKLIKDLQNVTDTLISNADKLNSSSEGLTTTSSTLSFSTSQQASALQETASAIHQVTSTIEQNSMSTNQSRTESNQSTVLAKEGQMAIDEMVNSIHQISDGNQQIVIAVEQGNNEIAKIVKVIEEIGGKTKVINDIVFQTKLLSFNASVEAARAGEHGKGFAVVAEEVGNLAEMSGNAAKEISNMLDDSIRQVQEIVDTTKSRVGGLVEGAKNSLNTGVNTAEKCKTALDKVLGSVQTVDTMISSIAVASAEQATGVGEINKAITQLDQITHKNARGAEDCATAAQGLSAQSQSMKLIAEDLRRFINGGDVISAHASKQEMNSKTQLIKASVAISTNELGAHSKSSSSQNKQEKLATSKTESFKSADKTLKSGESDENTKIKVKSSDNMPKKNLEQMMGQAAKVVLPAKKLDKDKAKVETSQVTLRKEPTNENTISVPDANDSRFEDV